MGVVGCVIVGNLALDATTEPASQDLEQSGLATARWAHQRQDLTRVHTPRNALEDVFAAAAALIHPHMGCKGHSCSCEGVLQGHLHSVLNILKLYFAPKIKGSVFSMYFLIAMKHRPP